MSVEIWSVVALVLMLVAITAFQGVLVPIEHGLKWGLGSRDEPREPSILQHRLRRTVSNQIEAMLIYIPLMLLTLHLGISNGMTHLAAELVIGGRLAFILLYVLGIFGLRSIAYGVALAGSAILLLQLI